MAIGYVGPFGDSNFGDYAMLINDVLDIGEKNINIFTYDLMNVELICKKYLRDFNYQTVSVDIDNDVNITESKKYTIEYNDYAYVSLEILEMVKNYEYLYEKILEIDTLVIIGGGYFNHIWNAKHRQFKLLSIMAVIIMANQCNKKLVFLGNTYGPFLESDKMFANFFSVLNNVIIGVRDNILSPIWMKQLGVNNDLYLLPDDLYFLNKELLNKPDYELKKSNKYILLEVYYSISEIENNINVYREFVIEMNKKYGYDVLFLPFDKRYGGEYQGDILKENINEIKVFSIKNDEFLQITDTIELVKNADLVICNRYHLFVFALANNIPVVQVLKDVIGNKSYYYCKSKGILDQILDSIQYCEMDFFTTTIEQAFNNVKNNIESIIKKQNKYYGNRKIYNESKLIEKRKLFIKKYINKA